MTTFVLSDWKTTFRLALLLGMVCVTAIVVAVLLAGNVLVFPVAGVGAGAGAGALVSAWASRRRRRGQRR